MADTTNSSSSSDRRTFLKVGAGVVGGLVVGAAAAYVAKPSTTSTTTQTTTVPTTVTSTGPGSTVTTTLPGTTSTATSTTTTTLPNSTVTSTTTSTTTSTDTSEVTALQTQLTTQTAFVMLNSVEQLEVEALAELMIPSDSNGPGAKEAGAIYFIDQMLAGVYGFNAKNYMQGPFVQPNISTPVTVKGVEWSVASPGSPATASLPTCITYSAGTLKQSLGCGFYYQHPFQLREFWETGLANLETYCNSAYGGNFETLSTTLQAQAVTDCWNNTPTNFTSPTPAEFISEVQEMVWAGFITDPIHGGNKNMVGWTYVGHNGVNEGNFFGCGYTTKQLMVMCTPVRLKPASIGQLEAVLGQNVS